MHTADLLPMTRLFSPKRIGEMEIANRVVMAAMTTRLADARGCVSAALLAYYAARAAGGAGLVIVEMAASERVGRHGPHALGIDDDAFLPGLRTLAAAIHEHGAKAAVQLGHAGAHAQPEVGGEPPIAPSAATAAMARGQRPAAMAIEMTQARIARTTDAFVQAAQRAHAAGFDGVELHAAHGSLLAQFLCPVNNQRGDEYGGSLANRARLCLEVLRAIKSALPGFPVIVRLNATDLRPHCMSLTDGLQVARWAAAEGADALHITADHSRAPWSALDAAPPMEAPEGVFLEYAARVKENVTVPVIAVGRCGDPGIAMQAIDTHKADFVALGRALLAEPQWVAKVRAERPVRRCLACNRCVDDLRAGARLGCAVNAAAGHELQYTRAVPCVRGQRIAVIGAGPAGLTYAELVAGSNSVTVFERESRTGGALRYAGLVPRFEHVEARQEPLDAYLDALEQSCRSKNVVFRLNFDIGADPDCLHDFDRIVVATGARDRMGLGAPAVRLLQRGWGRSRLARRLFAVPVVQEWVTRRGRCATLPRLGAVDPARVTIIGDAVAPGHLREAVAAAFEAALVRTEVPS